MNLNICYQDTYIANAEYQEKTNKLVINLEPRNRKTGHCDAVNRPAGRPGGTVYACIYADGSAGPP